jgi:hypothetical protein
MFTDKTKGEKRNKFHPIIVKLICIYIGFLIVNFYADSRYDMESFLLDYPDFFLGDLMAKMIEWIFPAAFIIFGLFARESLDLILKENIKKSYIKLFYILGIQIVLSFIFFYIIWTLMFHIPKYPSPLDQSLFMGAFAGYCAMIFFTAGILASDELKKIIENMFGNLSK